MADAKQGVAGLVQSALALAAVVVAVVAIGALRWVGAKNAAATEAADEAVHVSAMQSSVERASAGARAFLLTGDTSALVRSTEARAIFAAELASLGARTPRREGKQAIARIASAETRYETALDGVIALQPRATIPRRSGAAFEWRRDARPNRAQAGPRRHVCSERNRRAS